MATASNSHTLPVLEYIGKLGVVSSELTAGWKCCGFLLERLLFIFNPFMMNLPGLVGGCGEVVGVLRGVHVLLLV